MDIYNDIQLTSYMEDIARRVIDKCTEEILDVFKKQYIEEFAYVKGNPKEYIRTWEFRDAWVWTDIKKYANEIATTMFHDWSSMPSVGARGVSPFTHTTFEKERWHDDARPYLAETLDNMKSKAFITGNRTGGYWDKFISGYVESGKLDMLIAKHAKASGLVVSVS